MTLSEETVLPWYFPKVSTFWLKITYFSISLRNFKLRSRMKCWIQIFWCSYMNEVSDLKTKFIKWSLFCQFMIVVSKLITEDLQAKRKPHWLPLAVAHVSSTTWEDGERFLIKISINLWYLLIYFLQKQPLCIWCSRSKCLFLLRLIIKRGRLPWSAAGQILLVTVAFGQEQRRENQTRCLCCWQSRKWFAPFCSLPTGGFSRVAGDRGTAHKSSDKNTFGCFKILTMNCVTWVLFADLFLLLPHWCLIKQLIRNISAILIAVLYQIFEWKLGGCDRRGKRAHV